MSSEFSVDEAKREIYEDGFFVIENPTLGERMDVNMAYNFSSETGFKFCYDFVLSDSRVRETIDALGRDINSQFILAYCSGLAPDSRILSFQPNGGDKPSHLLVHAWSKGSNSTYYGGSHQKQISKVKIETDLLRTLLPQLKNNGLVGTRLGHNEKDENCRGADGCLVIYDARVSFEPRNGWSYFYVFVEKAHLEERKRKGSILFTGLRPPASQDWNSIAQLGVDVQRDEGS
ncbi:hypothetical protein Forpi1262_v014555 [Fusarium oxysporum f. sp. raphani]|uniref:Uncharacterized protein n=1 Tax=Fusarium oxysporum f. sp. raphani TaxID=96318 RepID=A0A8J5UHK3_FUSOX|nr:hypothetical protein Forpi1262_v014555 [Fusarium oxysporum f. sp. raphani]